MLKANETANQVENEPRLDKNFALTAKRKFYSLNIKQFRDPQVNISSNTELISSSLIGSHKYIKQTGQKLKRDKIRISIHQFQCYGATFHNVSHIARLTSKPSAAQTISAVYYLSCFSMFLPSVQVHTVYFVL